MVLVLDLDNTLLHSCEQPMSKEMLRDKKYWQPGCEVQDADRSLYHIWCPQSRFSYRVKMRPFLREFMAACL